jgi:hypothetical protein
MRPLGIGPNPSRWKRDILPIYYERDEQVQNCTGDFWSGAKCDSISPHALGGDKKIRTSSTSASMKRAPITLYLLGSLARIRIEVFWLRTRRPCPLDYETKYSRVNSHHGFRLQRAASLPAGPREYIMSRLNPRSPRRWVAPSSPV